MPALPNSTSASSAYTAATTTGSVDSGGSLIMKDNTVIHLGSYKITAQELAHKLQLLDRLTLKEFPEEHI